MKSRFAMIQMESAADPAANLAKAERFVQEAMELYGLRSVDNDILTLTLVAPSVSTTIDTTALRMEDPDTYEKLIEVYPKKTERRQSLRMKLK